MFIDDKTRVRHMLDVAEEAGGFIKGKDLRDIVGDRALAFALVKEIEIVGEAASKISEEFRGKHPEISWQDIIAMRNRLIHAYCDIDCEVVWDTVKNELPKLARKLKEAC
jgi:uncharacterized protein with HEPN domain